MKVAVSKRFVAAAAAALLVVAAYIVWTGLRIGRDAITVGVMDYGQAAAALIAAASWTVGKLLWAFNESTWPVGATSSQVA